MEQSKSCVLHFGLKVTIDHTLSRSILSREPDSQRKNNKSNGSRPKNYSIRNKRLIISKQTDHVSQKVHKNRCSKPASYESQACEYTNGERQCHTEKADLRHADKCRNDGMLQCEEQANCDLIVSGRKVIDDASIEIPPLIKRGFCCYNSQTPPFTIQGTPCKSDGFAEILDAAIPFQ